MAIAGCSNPNYNVIRFQLYKIELVCNNNFVRTGIGEDFSLTGAYFKCSAYQHPGRRRGLVANTLQTGANGSAM